MANIVNEILLTDLTREFRSMGSCVVVEFGKLKPQHDREIRGQLRAAGIRYRVVRNRLAARAFAALDLDMGAAMSGRCGIAIAQKEGAIQAAKKRAEELGARVEYASKHDLNMVADNRPHQVRLRIVSTAG